MVVARERRSEDRIGFIIPVSELSEPRRFIQAGLRWGIKQEDLTIELFLPFSLMNQPIERMGILAGMDVEPLGIGEMECPHVLLRSRDRLEERSRVQSRWHKKCTTLISKAIAYL